MKLDLPENAMHPVIWTQQLFAKRGKKLPANEEGLLVQSWNEYVEQCKMEPNTEPNDEETEEIEETTQTDEVELAAEREQIQASQDGVSSGPFFTTGH